MSHLAVERMEVMGKQATFSAEQLFIQAKEKRHVLRKKKQHSDLMRFPFYSMNL